MLSWDYIQANAVAFSKKWKAFKGIEKQHDQQFITELLACFGVNAGSVGIFQEKAGKKWVDYLWAGMLGIEMKTPGENLISAKTQLFNYLPKLPPEAVPQYLIVSDFVNIHLYRLSTNDVYELKTADLRKHIKKFADIAGYTTERIREDQLELNVKAAEKMAKLHDELESHGYEGNDLEVYLVRLLFCMFAGDTGIFPHGNFYHYIKDSKEDGSDLSHRISDLFEVLNMPSEVRAKKKLLSDELKSFKYINGRLFEKILPKADFNAKMRKLLLECREFDWSEISPAIFGAMFQGVMDKTKRRELGAHYTSEENILKLINPLFLDNLYAEFEKVKSTPAALDRFHDKIARLKFLDPACGCGNFLIITYRELRLLELEILKMKQNTNQLTLDMEMSGLLKVTVEQFYGIEYEDFPCQIATVGMWLVDHQMNLKVSELIGAYHDRLPLKQSATIVHGNALRIDWKSVVGKDELSYILGNPPFVGKKEQSKEQKRDLIETWGKLKGVGNLDYVTAWYKKAADFTQGTYIKCAFVSTNSIAQGEQVAVLWKPLIEQDVYINFGVTTFIWNNEAKGKAAVHCVIIGFSYIKTEPNINPYLIEAPTVFIESKSKPICDVPKMVYGSMPIDNGALILSEEEKEILLKSEPKSDKFIRRYVGGDELINNTFRYCLWLKGFAPHELMTSKFVIERVNICREFREQSNRPQTKALADTPHLFGEIRQPDSDMLVIPKVSSENRKYIPIGFLSSKIIVNGSALIIPAATFYHFGILSSNVHNAFMRAVCGRLEMRYQYSGSIVYNNFPWVDVSNEQKIEIEKLAQDVLKARKSYPESTLAAMYGENSMLLHSELLKAHKALDRAVMKLYGFSVGVSEGEIVAGLMERYRELVEVK